MTTIAYTESAWAALPSPAYDSAMYRIQAVEDPDLADMAELDTAEASIDTAEVEPPEVAPPIVEPPVVEPPVAPPPPPEDSAKDSVVVRY